MIFISLDFYFFKDYPIFVKIVWILTVVFFIFLSIAIIYLKRLRTRIRERQIYLKKQQKKYEELIISYLYANEESLEVNNAQRLIIKEIKFSLQKVYNRRILTEALLKFKGEVSGLMEESAKKMYREVGLLKQTKLRLHFKEWHIIVIAIRDCRKFGIEEERERIKNFLNHENAEVRRQAYLYFLELFGFEGLDFLNELKVSISLWDEIGVFEALSKFKNQKTPSLDKITKWLRSKNVYVVGFALNFVKIYGLLDTKNEIILLLHHESDDIKYKVINLLKDFYVIEAKPLLKISFESFNTKEQIAVFKYIEEIHSIEDESFILQHVNNTVFEIKVIAIRILKEINFKSFLKLKEELKDENSIRIINYTENNL